MKFQELDDYKLAQKLLRMPLASMHGDHAYIKSTLEDYIKPSEDDLEGQFVKDLFVLRTDEIIDKWYGGKWEAMNLINIDVK
ncbi:hypothetical protein [Priestia megaterium]|nr:hypothetical protein [Priestia megaterium]AUO14702.1 hypothetical protein C0569_25810 [Priestia megaterium]